MLPHLFSWLPSSAFSPHPQWVSTSQILFYLWLIFRKPRELQCERNLVTYFRLPSLVPWWYNFNNFPAKGWAGLCLPPPQTKKLTIQQKPHIPPLNNWLLWNYSWCLSELSPWWFPAMSYTELVHANTQELLKSLEILLSSFSCKLNILSH